VLMLGVAAAPFCFVPRLTGARVVLNTDGLEWRRRKWGRIASLYLRLSERAACITADRLVTDARCVQEYYRQVHRQETTFIPYGARVPTDPTEGTLASLGLEPEEYVLYVSRFEPENNALLVRRAFEAVRTQRPLVMVGSAPYADEYVRRTRDTSDRRVRFPGAIYGDAYLELQAKARVYVQASEVGGTHPALVEAIGMGRCIIANDVPEHREVLGDAGIYYDGAQADLTRALQEVLDHPEVIAEYQARTRGLAARYSWDTITGEYEALFVETASRRRLREPPC
jgi:glycosyltransferase involved in cell wall biosynthesis